MINLIGAYIITILLIGIVAKRPDFQAFEDSLIDFAGYKRLVVCALLLLLLPSQFDVGQNISLLKPFALFSSLFDGFNLWIHEAGHVYFSWDGDVLHSLGGTLNEVLFPLFFMALSWVRRRPASFWLSVYWISFNFIGIGLYMADARAQVLPLLGGGTHDWLIIFGSWGLLDLDTVIGGTVRMFGLLLAIVAAGVISITVPPLPFAGRAAVAHTDK